MKANEINLLKFLNGPKQFIIPIYQRTYSWRIEECEQLWRDVLKTATDQKVTGHFLGSIVYVEKGLYQVSSVPQLLVIDGQQRLTTMSLLLRAISNTLTDNENGVDVSKKKIENYYLFNGEEKHEMRYKLILTQNDRDTLTNTLDGRELPNPSSRRITENYEFFVNKIRESKIDPKILYQGIAKLIIVDISLNREYDNPQLIFESMNSTGLELTQADLIRNYVLMGLDREEQEELYNEYWHKIELSFGQNEYVTIFDKFMRDYLTIKLGEIPKINRVYIEFKNYVYDKKITAKDIVPDIYKYSKYFVKIALEKEDDENIRLVISNINRLKVDVAYPFLLELFEDYSNDKLTKDELLEILKLIESYVFRRAICGVPTNSMNKTFARLSRELDKQNYLESFKAIMVLKDSYRRFPNNAEFKQAFKIKDVYNFRSRDYLLDKLENYDRKEKVLIEDYTIEHIMPQTLSETWKTDLGSNHDDIYGHYLHTIGNITLTGYNPEMSNHPFKEKRDMEGGFKDSPIRLNRTLATLEKWSESEIQNRAEELAALALEIWVYPKMEQSVLEKYRKETKKKEHKTYSLEDHTHLKGETRELFEHLRKRILNLDSSVTEDVLKLYIAYKTTKNFVDIIPQKNRLRLVLNMEFDEITDPKGFCRDITGKGKWGNGDIEVDFDSMEQLDYIMSLVKQSFEKHWKEEYE